ncbi:MAG: Outer membrane protein assembly factor BamD [Opitutia bacterium UBA7350]|nr:MAG: Outer membrane protein assembly factor BamD [Opitutae bacterium UBA7350]
MIPHPTKVLALLALTLSLPGLHSQEYAQMAFSEVKSQASAYVANGNLVAALPILQELVKRVEGAPDSDVEIDYPVFLIGSAYIQNFTTTGSDAELSKALSWFDRLENDYPDSKYVKAATLKRIDVLRVLKRTDEAVELIKALLSGKIASINLSYSEENKVLKDLCQTLYYKNQLSEGLPYFNRLSKTARSVNDRGLAAAASFEAYLDAKQLDAAMELLPYLAKEFDARYQPRINVALLKASDTMNNEARLSDASILLNLIKTTDLMIEFHEQNLTEKTKRIETYEALKRNSDRIIELKQEIKVLENTLSKLRALPTLRNELLVRRARNFSKTNRPYESFWMFYDLLKENPDDKQSEFFHYAAFSGANKVNKDSVLLELGRSYRSQYPEGDFYSDVTAGLVDKLQKLKQTEELIEVVVDFLNRFPSDPFSSNFLALWSGYMIERDLLPEIIEQCRRWRKMHTNPTFADGLYFWQGLAHLQLTEFQPALDNFSELLEQYPTSLYAEDSTLRKGICQFYVEAYNDARTTLLSFTEKYQKSPSLDQAFYFLGEIESIAGDFEVALTYFRQADEKTQSQSMHDAVAFRIGDILEAKADYAGMLQHFKTYAERFGESGRLTDAYLQVGRAYEFLNQPNAMLALYRKTIEQFAGNASNQGVDALIENYAEKYYFNHKRLTRTVAFLDQMRDDLAFRETMLADRGALFEVFYYDEEIDPSLYNKLRNHPNFTIELMDDLGPMESMVPDYRSELAGFPKKTPEMLYRELLKRFQANGDRVAECRMLMGLYRRGKELAPIKPYDDEFTQKLSPRLLLYVADYKRSKDINFAEKTWNQLLKSYPSDDAAIVAHLRLADVRVGDQDLKTALQHLESIEASFPGSPQIPAVILRQGELLSQLGKGDQAREKYQYILRVPDWRGIAHARALLQIGTAYMAEEAHEQAHGFFERTFLGYSNFPEVAAQAYLADADALLKLNDPQGAKLTLSEALDQLIGNIPSELYASLQEKYDSI